MDHITFDCSQLDQVDFLKQPPVPLRTGSNRLPLSSTETAVLKAALRFGSSSSPILKTLTEIADIGSTPVAVTLLAPTKMPVVTGGPIIKFGASHSRFFTGALAVAASASVLVFGAVESVGLYGSTTREVGKFASFGGGLFFNSPGTSVGVELTLIQGTPVDFSGPYFGISVGAGAGVTTAFTVLFSPSLPLTVPLILTFMGAAANVSASTPTKLPVTISIEVTNTRITALKMF